ncbi:MAG: hypothetical protein WD826_00435 [Actinomycetota bacterium]
MRRLIAPLSYLGTTVALFHESWAAPTTRFIGLRGDPDQTIWFLAWGAHAVRHLANPFTSGAILYPDGVNLTWNAAVTLPSVLATPVTVLGGPTLTYNVLMTVAVASSAWAAYAAARHFGAGAFAAYAGGLLYGFSPFMTTRALGHLNLAFAAFAPLVLICAHRALVKDDEPRPRRWALLAGTLLGLQILVWSETVVIIAVGVAAYTASRYVVEAPRRADIRRRVGRSFAPAAAGALVIGALPLYHFFLGSARPDGPLHAYGKSGTHIGNLVTPSAALQFAPEAAQRITQTISLGLGGRSAYIGVPLIVLHGWAIARFRRDVTVRTFALAAAIVVVVSFDPAVTIDGEPRTILTSIPLVRHLLPHRSMLMVYLFAAIIVARFLTDLARTGGRRQLAIGCVAFGAVALSFLPRLPFPSTDQGVPPAFLRVAPTIPERSVAVVLPASRAMLWQATTDMRFSMPTGRAFARTTTGIRYLERELQLVGRDPSYRPTRERIERTRRELRRLGVRTVLLVPVDRDASAEADRARYGHGPSALTVAFGDRSTVEMLTEIFGVAPERSDGAFVWRDPGAPPSSA